MGVKDRKYKIYIRDKTDSTALTTLDTAQLIGGSVTDELNGEQSLTFVIDRRDSAWSDLSLGNIARLYNTETGTYVTYRIKKTKQWRAGEKLFGQAYCEHLKYDLAHRVVNTQRSFIQVTPQTVLEFILGYSDGFTVGSVTPTDLIDFDIDFETCYEAIKRLADLTGYDWEVIADGSANHKKVYIRTIDNTTNGTPGTCDIEYGVNLLSVSEEKSIVDGFASRIVARGGASVPGQRRLRYNIQQNINAVAMDVTGAQFAIESYDSGTGWITLKTDKLLAQDDALNGYYVFLYGFAGAYVMTEILDSAKTTGGNDKIQVDKTISDLVAYGLAENDIAVIYTDINTPSNYVPDAKAESDYIRVEKPFREDIADLLNQAGPAGISDLSGTYTSGLCQGWQKIGSPTVTENTTSDYIKHGTKSQKVVAADGEGVKVPFYYWTVDKVSFYVWVYIQSLAAGAKLYFRVKVGSDEYFPQNPNTGEDEAFIENTGWYQVIVEGGDATINNGELEIFVSGGSATFYVDSACVVLNEYMPDENQFFTYDSRTVLWGDVITDLQQNNSPRTRYEISMVDLYEHDSTQYSSLEFKVGDDVDLIDSGLGLNTTVRVLKKVWNLLKPWEVTVDIE